MVDLSRLLIILHELGHVKGLDRNTCSQYFTSAKTEALTLQELTTASPISPAWGTKGKHHPLISRAIASIPKNSPKPHGIITKKWIKYGFSHKIWSITEYVAISFISNWMLRVGEAALPQEKHIITWSMIKFYFISSSNEMIPMPLDQLNKTPCHMVTLTLHSRKKQPVARHLPGRVNFANFSDPSKGCTEWCDLCIATILQGWAIYNNIWQLTQEELDHRPLLYSPDLRRCITPEEITAALRRNAAAQDQDPSIFTATDLRRGSITKLAQSDIPIELYLQAVGHKQPESSRPYLVPDVKSAQLVTENLNS